VFFSYAETHRFVTLFMGTPPETPQKPQRYTVILWSIRQKSTTQRGGKQEMEVPQFTKLDRDFLLELSRIGNNINQLAHAVNRDLASDRPLDAARLLYLLVGVEQALKELRDDR
jgi:hypothetical protein